MADSLCPKNRVEEVALFRAQVLGPVLNRELHRGELITELRALSKRRFRPPGAPRTRTYSVPTLLRWHRAFKAKGLKGLTPKSRVLGDALGVSEDERALLLAIRREHPHAAATVILETLEDESRLERGKLSPSTLRRLYRKHGLRRGRRRDAKDPVDGRRRWEAGRAGDLWHADVCHGPTLVVDKKRIPIRIHAIMDDKSRFVTALAVHDHEREVAMLELVLESIRSHGAPGTLYLDNGSTYSGEALSTACGRLNINLVHATPYNPKARGKMERFWRTMREGCLDLMGPVTSLHEVRVRLAVWLSRRYHTRAHSGLVGHSPATVWDERERRKVDNEALSTALIVRGRRKVGGDGVLCIGGLDWEVREHFLVGKIVDIARTLAEPNRAPWVEYADLRIPLHLVDPVANGKRGLKKRKRRPGLDAIDFDPTRVMLDKAMGRLKGGQR